MSTAELQCAAHQTVRIQKTITRSKPEPIALAGISREEFHRRLDSAMVRDNDVAALAGEIAKRIALQVSEVGSVDEDAAGVKASRTSDSHASKRCWPRSL